MALPVRFDHRVYTDFIDSITPLLDNGAVHEIKLDFRWTTYIDSSALGMLLQLHESADRADKPVSLLNVSGIVLKVFDVANLGAVFNIRHANPSIIKERRSLDDRRAIFIH